MSMNLTTEEMNQYLATRGQYIGANGVICALPPKGETPKKSKYSNIKTACDGIMFDSAKEMRRYQELKLLRQHGEVICFCRQPVIELPGGVKYVGDFLVMWKQGYCTVEDVKGFKTRAYKDKKKQVLACYGVEIQEK
jgi:hypothetical protein